VSQVDECGTRPEFRQGSGDEPVEQPKARRVVAVDYDLVCAGCLGKIDQIIRIIYESLGRNSGSQQHDLCAIGAEKSPANKQ
jgi:hypothetical protein